MAKVGQGGSRWDKVGQGGTRRVKVGQGGSRWDEQAIGDTEWNKLYKIKFIRPNYILSMRKLCFVILYGIVELYF